MNFPQKEELKVSEVRFLNCLELNGHWIIRFRTLRRLLPQLMKIPMKMATQIMVASLPSNLKSALLSVICRKLKENLILLIVNSLNRKLN